MDKYDKETRSRMMSAVRSKGNRSTEVRFRAYLAQAGVKGWRMHVADMPGKPDFVFDEAQLIVFVDGCFWHGCPRCCRMPASRQDYWNNKIATNQQRDNARTEALRQAGWQVLRVWEHQIKESPQNVVAEIKRLLRMTDKTERLFP